MCIEAQFSLSLMSRRNREEGKRVRSLCATGCRHRWNVALLIGAQPEEGKRRKGRRRGEEREEEERKKGRRKDEVVEGTEFMSTDLHGWTDYLRICQNLTKMKDRTVPGGGYTGTTKIVTSNVLYDMIYHRTIQL